MTLLDKMSLALGMDKQYILKCSKKNSSYTIFEIKTKKGGTRWVMQPSKELKVLQYWLNYNILNEFPVSKFSTAYSKGNSIKKNALLHSCSKYILHTDIKKFFINITREMLAEFFANNNRTNRLTKDDINLILDIILYKGEYLVIGSVASPRVANCFMYDFDMMLYDKIIRDSGMIYSRYADDIVISSSKYIDLEILNRIDFLLEQYGLSRNLSKTYFMNTKGKRIITGIIIDNNTNSLSLGSKNYRRIKKDLYNFLVKGQGDLNRLAGYLSFIKDINLQKYLSLQETYKKYDKKEILFK